MFDMCHRIPFPGGSLKKKQVSSTILTVVVDLYFITALALYLNVDKLAKNVVKTDIVQRSCLKMAYDLFSGYLLASGLYGTSVLALVV